MLFSFLFFSYIILVLTATLFPFEFVIAGPVTPASIFSNMEWYLLTRFAIKDFPRNVLLFIPLGLGLAYKLRSQNTSWVWSGIITLFAGACLSLSIEILQQFIPFRFSAAADLLANSIGALAGFLAFTLWGRQAEKYFKTFLEKWYLPFSGRWLAIGSLTYIILISIGLAFLQQSTRLSSWDEAYPLVLGNEATGDRPWRGSISELAMTNRSISPEQAAAVFKNENLGLLTDASFLARYNFSGPGPYPDQYKRLPDLVWQNDSEPGSDQNTASFGPGRWVETPSSVELLADAVQQTSQFTLSLILSTDDINQTGPARIFSISTDPYHRNLTLGQEGADLVIRLRNGTTGENAKKPEIIIHDTFSKPGQRHIVVTYTGKVLSVYIDSERNNTSFTFSPEINLFWRLAISETSGIRAGSANLVVLRLLFYGLIVFPPIFLLILYQTTSRPSPQISPVQQQR